MFDDINFLTTDFVFFLSFLKKPTLLIHSKGAVLKFINLYLSNTFFWQNIHKILKI